MATSPVTSASYSLRERGPTPSDTRTSGRGTPLRDRNIVVIDGKRFRMQIRHKGTGEIVKVPPHIWENIRPATEETFHRLVEAAKTTGNHNNFKARHIQKIQIDLSVEPYTIRYTSKASADTEEELEEATEFTLDVSPTNARVHQHAIKQFGTISHVVSSSMAPPRPIRMSNPSDEERTVSGSGERAFDRGNTPEDTIHRLQSGQMLDTHDITNYTTRRLLAKDPNAKFFVTQPAQLLVGERDLKLFEGLNPVEQAKLEEFRADSSHPLILYVHHGPHVDHFSVIVAKDGNLYVYDPKGNSLSKYGIDLKEVYKGIYGEEAAPSQILEYSPDQKIIQIMNTVCTGLGLSMANETIRSAMWGYIDVVSRVASDEDLLHGAIMTALDPDNSREDLGPVNAALREESERLAEEEVTFDVKTARMVKAAADALGREVSLVDLRTAFNGAREGDVSALIEDFRHQKGTDGVSCGVFSLDFAESMLEGTRDTYYHYVSTPTDGTVPGALRARQATRLQASFCAAFGAVRVPVEVFNLPSYRPPSHVGTSRDIVRQMGAHISAPRSTPIPDFPLTTASGPVVDAEGRPVVLTGDEIRRIQASTKVYYTTGPDILQSADELETLLKLEFPSGSEAAERRTRMQYDSKFKVITSENCIWMDERGRPIQPVGNGITLTAVAPNLRKASGEDPEDYFDYLSCVNMDTEPHTLNRANPRQIMRPLVQLQLTAFQREGVQALVLPAFGGGQFSAKFPEYSEVVAEVYKELLEGEFDDVFQEVHFALPTIGGRDNFGMYRRAFAGYGGETPVYLAEKDATGIIRTVAARGLKWGELNPGNARSKVGHTWDSASTAYEQCCARRSALLVGQDKDLNPTLITDRGRWVDLTPPAIEEVD